MAQSDIKSAQIGTQSHDHESTEIDAPRPTGWMYKSIGIGKFKIGWYASPKFQLGMVAFVCFMCPGMFNALSGLGGGGKSDPKLADDMVCLFLLIPTIVVILHLLSSPPEDNCFSHD